MLKTLLTLALLFAPSAFAQAPVYVDGVTIKGDGTPFNPLNGAKSSIGTSINVKNAPYNALGDTRLLPSTVYNPIGFPTGKILAGFPASTFTQADVGKFIGCVEGASGLFRAGGFITSVDSATQVSITNVVSQGAGGGTSCYLGHFDDVPFASAYTAATTTAPSNCNVMDGTAAVWNGGGCANLYIPCGGYLLSKPFVTGGQVAANIRTDGEQCTIFFMYSFFDITGVGANFGAFMTFMGQYSDSFTLTAAGNSFSFPNNPILNYACNHCEVHGPNVTAVGNGNSNAVVSWSNGGGHSRYFNPIVRDVGAGGVSGSVLCDIAGVGEIDFYGIFCSNGFQNLRVSNITGGTTGSRVSFFGGQIDECGINSLTIGCTQIVASKDISFFGTNLISGSNNATPGISIDGTSEVRLSGNNIGPFGGNGGGCITVLSGGKVWYSEMNFHAAGSGTQCITDQNPVAAPGAFDVGGNKYVLTGGAVQFGGTARPFATLTHNWNTCYVTGTFGAVNLCAHFLDQPSQLIRIKASSGVATACTVNPVVTVTDGVASQTLTITTAGTSWDSGAVTSNVLFAQGNTLTISVTAGTCTTPPTNFSVTYNTYESGGQ